MFAHSASVKCANLFHSRLKRTCHITPKKFIVYVKNFSEELKMGYRKLKIATGRLDSGLSKLTEATVTIDIMQLELSNKKVLPW